MMKTITVRIDDSVYSILKKAADGERRTISNFLENASLSYLTNEIYVSDYEMAEILKDAKLVSGIKKGLSDVKKGKYTIFE
ncbi:MAG TPA: CopG family transcriptional regulator [Spirochaetota bacterium]|nr:CopG family transcriptional regulator [Spirochaetota bacterium]